jgi:tetratricopeptide (TPR) repeat protein
MFFDKVAIPKLILLISFLFLMACANKQVVVETDPVLESARLDMQKEQEQFKYALGLIQTENAQENDLLKAKEILDALYQGNSAYLGALINSADISLKLERLEEAKALYLEAIQKVEHAQESLNTSQAVPEHNTMFSVHIYNQLGLIERQKGQFDQSESYYRQALALEPDKTATLKNLAILLDLYRGKLAEALVLYEHYQSIVNDSDSEIVDPRIKDWIYDLKNRLPAEELNNE